MENVANIMTSKVGESYQLAEFVSSQCVKEEAKKLFEVSTDPILAILLNSVLIAQSIRKGSILNVTFAYRIFHEYFLASYLVREKLRNNGYPNAVKSFYLDIKSSPSATY
jgi:hypothetical protein